ncbi:MAG: AarF/UbiB family protein [Nitriliruptorales bacterium]|nr:AarF/UbiB family protein [Nitriliruptorales bacterium]
MEVLPDRLERTAQIVRVLFTHLRNDIALEQDFVESLGEEAELHDPDVHADAEQLADDLEELGPTFIKLGQLLSTRADLLPGPYLEALQSLQDDVAPVPVDEIVTVIERELGVRLSKVFPRFDEEPLASASLAQVHLAETRDGRRVAVKVQRPGIRETIRTDLQILEDVAEKLDAHTDTGAHFRTSTIVDEFRKSLARELDYRREAHNLDALRRNLSPYENVVLPGYIDDYSTSRVLTMEYVEGEKITEMSPLAPLEFDAEELADELFEAYLQQILADGFVHADPHPGNVHLTPDRRLVLFDVGMVMRIEPEVRETLLKMLVGVAEGDVDEAASTAIELGDEGPAFDEARFHREVSELLGRYKDLPPEDIHIGGILTDITRISGETGLKPPPELTLLARTLMSLDIVGRTLQPDFDADAAIRRHAGSIMTEAMFEQLTPSSILRSVLDTKELVESLPSRINAIMERLASGEFDISVETIDEDRLIRTIRKTANRVTAGLIVAALIVGTAMLMRVQTQAQLFGYPAVAIIFFLVAAGIGLSLIVAILLDDKDDPP